MAKRSDIPGIKPYSKPAGGWGAVRATARAVREQMDVHVAPLLLLRTNKPDGFDCPGCAWPDRDHTSTFQFCENGAKAVTWEATRKRVTPEFFQANTVASLWQWTDSELENEGRLTHPVAYDRASDTYQAISWEDAFARIGAALRALPDPNMAEFYTSGRTSNEAAFLYQIFVREYGTNNFPDCSNMCHEATSVGLPKSIGIGKGTVSLDDFDRCELIISMGHNPGTNHPRMMGTLHEVARRGVPIIVLNPLKERALERFADPQNPVEMSTLGSTAIASSYYQVKVGGDSAALTGIMKALLAMDEAARAVAQPAAAGRPGVTGQPSAAGQPGAAGQPSVTGQPGVTGQPSAAGQPGVTGQPSAADESATGVLDHEFITTHTNGFATLAASLRAADWADIEYGSGLTRPDLETIAAAYARSNATIVSYGMGITQHLSGTSNVQQIANLLLLRGNIGKPGAGICPLRGHSNVQGDRTVGIWEKPPAAMLQNIERTFGFQPPSAHGHDAVAAMEAMLDGRSKVFVSLGGNLPVALSDPQRCFQAMRNLDFAVHIATKLNRSHLLIGKDSIILPCLGRTEEDVQATGPQSVTVEDSMSMVHASRGKLPPASGHLRSEPVIVAEIARATLPDSKVPWLELVTDYDRIRDLIEAVFPEFEDYNIRIRRPGGFRLPLHATERVWKTPSGRAEFLLPQAPPAADRGDPKILLLTTIRSHDQYNTTIYGSDDRYRGVFGRRDVVFMNEQDLAANNLKHGDVVDIQTALPSFEHLCLNGFTAVAYDIARGSAAAYYPEANCLVPLSYQDKDSGTPAYKSVPVRISRRSS